MCEPVAEHDSRKERYPNSGFCCRCNQWKEDVNTPCRLGHSHRGKIEMAPAQPPLIDLEANG